MPFHSASFHLSSILCLQPFSLAIVAIVLSDQGFSSAAQAREKIHDDFCAD